MCLCVYICVSGYVYVCVVFVICIYMCCYTYMCCSFRISAAEAGPSLVLAPVPLRADRRIIAPVGTNGCCAAGHVP